MSSSTQQNQVESGIDNTSGGRFAAWLILFCVIIVAVWEALSLNAGRAYEPYKITAADFAGFAPDFEGWRTESLPVGTDPLQPNVLVFRSTPLEGPLKPVQFRLVHGYNMRDCMRLKGYQVELLEDTRVERNAKQPVGDYAGRELPMQIWLLESPVGDLSVWISTMLRAADLNPTQRDMRSVPFPRIDMPMTSDWKPEGLRWSSLKHPIRNLRLFMRSKWNNARKDPLVFIGIKRPPWADPASFTYLTVAPLMPNDDVLSAARARAQSMHGRFYERLLSWWQDVE